MKKVCAIVVLLTAFFVLPMKAETVKVLSINNSLIDYNDQYAMFNSIAAEMGKDATWTKHTNLGKTLAYHFNEDPLVPNAKETVAGTAWTHIILQEQSSLPRTNYEQFRSNVQTWVNYIHTNCPTATIILPINWAYSDDASFQTNNQTLIANFRSVAQEFGLTLCPVAIAYGNYQIDHPSTLAADLYTDNRHPTQAASYLAACLEYAVIFSENPSAITWKPAALSETMAETMRAYAQEAYEGVERTEPLPVEPTPAISITGSTYSENFDIIGGEDVTESQIAASLDGKRSFDRATTLPVGWRIDNNTSAVRTVRSFAAASETTMYIGGQNLPSNARNGTWNFGLTGSTDRAVGGITSSVDGGARSVNVMVHLHNDAGVDFNTMTLAYDVEKYRNGANEAGFTVQLYLSSDGENWVSAGNHYCTQYAKDGDTNGAAVVPTDTKHVEGQMERIWEAGKDLYLAWNISVTSGTDCAKSMALAIDNVSVAFSKEIHIPDYAVLLVNTNPVTESFDAMGGTEFDPSTDAKTGILTPSTLPKGWKIERNMNGPRQLGAFSAAAETTMYVGGQSLASNAYNGTWNFGATGNSDRALGGLTTGIDGGTRGINVMVRLFNNSETDFETIQLAYDIEKYRNGSNAAGFVVQLYTSTNGSDWTSAGNTFLASYPADANNNGYAVVPASTKQVSGEIAKAVPVGGDLYLAWNISVASGTSCNAAPALAIDNVTITPVAKPTGIENMTGSASTVRFQKVLREGQMIIVRGNEEFNAQGARIR